MRGFFSFLRWLVRAWQLCPYCEAALETRQTGRWCPVCREHR